jgi:hypothetical protein
VLRSLYLENEGGKGKEKKKEKKKDMVGYLGLAPGTSELSMLSLKNLCSSWTTLTDPKGA